MPFPVKTWKDGPKGGTKLNATNLNDLESRISSSHEELADSISGRDVRSYGAVGDGSDESAAIQKALDDGGSVVIPAGFEFVASNLKPISNSKLGGGGKLIHKAGASTPLISTAAGVENVEISGLQIDGNGSKQTVSGLVSIQLGGSRIRFHDNQCANFKHDGIAIQPDATDVSVSFNDVDGTGRFGITLTSAGAADAPERVSVIGNHVRDTNDGALGIVGVGKHVTFQGNVLYDSVEGDGIAAYNRDNVHVSALGNVITEPGNHGIHLGGSQLTVSGNDIYAPAFNGILVAGDPNGSPTAGSTDAIVGNNIDSPGQAGNAANGAGVHVVNRTGFTIGNNVVKGAHGHGINLEGCVEGAVSGNAVRNSVVGDNLRIYQTQRLSVTGNLSCGAVAGKGISITASSPESIVINIVGNTVRGNAGGGVVASGNSNFINVEGNFIRNNSGEALSLGTTTSNRVGEGNHIDVSSTALTAGASLKIPLGSNTWHVANGGVITGFNSASAWRGRRVTLIFDGATEVQDTGNVLLSSAFSSTAGDTLTLICDGTNWYETGRSAN